ncbi:MAG TPA: ClpXP protease specificity-enhancing factor SspB [Hyphomicrobiaceae bacterium]|nr:ClpXP protease specificity-enhancing factor SspB [Hyphomicrobiaceae bacterium]
MTDNSHFDYEALSNDALRGVVKTVLTRVAKSGLPGNHHFFIGFDTRAEGVHISKRLLEKYPSEMTIVLQHRFWDLTVLDDRFEVKLSFDAIPERLVVPFAAIKVFFDPSVPYGLQFAEQEGDRAPPEDTEQRQPRAAGTTATPATAKKRTTRKSKSDRPADDETTTTEVPAALKRSSPRPVAETAGAESPAATKPAPVPAGTDAKVVSLDQFRKK